MSSADRIGRTYMSAKKYQKMRESLGLTQQQLADKLDVHVQTVTKRETADRAVRLESVYAMRYLVLESMYDLTGVFDESPF